MPFAAGDFVHVALFGNGVVREVRNGGRYLVDVKGNAMVVGEAQLKAADGPKRKSRAPEPPENNAPRANTAAASIDLHGRTTAEAESLVDAFLNDAMLAGLAEVRIIHGISGGRVKSAVHARLTSVPSIRGFRVDPSNPGVTIVTL